MNKIKKTLLVVLALLSATPSWAVFNERNLAQTLTVLRYELCKAYREMEMRQVGFEKQDEKQHEELIYLIKGCNELSLMLYSQKQNFTFDLTYALQQVTDQYHSFNDRRLPYDNIISYFDVEIERYERLVNSLKLLPPQLVEVPDSLGPRLLDSLARTLEAHAYQGNELPNESFIEEHLDDPSHEGHLHFVLDGEEADEEHDHNQFSLDSLSRVDRDSCLFYATKMLNMFTDVRDHMQEDSEYYETTNKRLKEAYDYAQERYKMVQKRIFVEGQTNYWSILTNFKSYLGRAVEDYKDKYTFAGESNIHSQWRGPVVLGFSFIVLVYLIFALMISTLAVKILRRSVKVFKSESFGRREIAILLIVALIIFVIVIIAAKFFLHSTHFFAMASSLLVEYALLLIAIFTSLLIRLTSKQVNHGLLLYMPIMLMGLVVIEFRIIFIPNSMITLLYPPILLIFAIWQRYVLKRHGNKVPKKDKHYAVISYFVTLAALVISVMGYALLGLQVYIWWIFQLTALQIIVALDNLLRRYHDKVVHKRIRAYKIHHNSGIGKDRGAYIMVTWLHDFIDMAVIPVLYVLSVPFCLYMASRVFDLTEVCMNLFFYSFFDYEYLELSIYKITLAIGLFFVFKYLCFAARAFYRIWKLRSMFYKVGTRLIRENEVNLTLANNFIGIVIWGTYAIVTIALINIPTKSLSVISAGLAAGLGFAMKDILNNFFYGIQLMGGRLRVGDTVECDGVRGRVEHISYQTTQITAVDGSQIAFPNSTLFAKTFKNLTRNDSYEYIALPVGVAYGTDVDKARKVIVKALSSLRKKDEFNRPLVKESYGFQVILNGFGDSSVDLLVKQFVLVEHRAAYIAKANEAIYNALNENGIEIPFPQCDVHMKDSEN